MQPGFEFGREYHIYRPLKLNPAKSFKRFRNYRHRVMRLAAGCRTGMTRMLCAIICYF